MTEQAQKSAATPPETEGDKRHAPMVAVAGLVFGAAGFALRKQAGTYAADGQAVLRRGGDRTVLVAEKKALDDRSDLARGAGTSLVPIGATLVVVALATMAGARLRFAAALLGLPLLFAAIFCVYVVGVESLIFTSILGIALVGFIASEPNPFQKRAVEDARVMPTRLPRDFAAPGADAYAAGVVRSREAAVKRRLAEVPTLPANLQRALAVVGVGKPAAFFKLKDSAAYLAFVEADELSVEEYTTVLMVLEEPAPRFVARPLPIVEGRAVPNTGIQFKKDPDFGRVYLVEAQPGQDPKAVRRFLNAHVRDALYDLDGVWFQVDGLVATATLYGAFDPDRTDRLVELADAVFAEYGVGGESLLEPDDVEVDGLPKPAKKKKKKKASAGTEAAPPS
jgi:hypothetical protein